MKERKNRKKVLIPAAMIIPGVILSILGLYYVSQQRSSREINLKKEYELRLNEIRQDIEERAGLSIDRVFSGLSEADTDLSDPAKVLDLIKSLVINNPVIRYPFIIGRNGEFIFPVRVPGKGSILRSPDLAASDPAVSDLYLEGRKHEFTLKDPGGALEMYMKSLKRAIRPGARPFILNAVARCYFKTGRFPQALYYYEKLIRDHENRIRENLPLWLTVLRQKALTRKNLGLIPESLQTYLLLYEQIIKHESLSGSDQFEMYKNEALDHLSRHREVLTGREFQAEGGPDLTGLRNMTDLDRLLDWRFTEPDTDGPVPENGSEERFLKLREMNTPSDEKTWFYRAVRERVRHRSPDPGNNQETFLLFPANRLVDIRYRSFGTRFPEGPAVFGFMVSADHIREELFPAEEKLTSLGGNTDLRIVYDADEIRDPPLREERTTLFKLPFKRVLNGYSLILSSGDPDFFSGLAAKEVWLNYSLIIALILFLLLGTLFFYRYTSKEMEMLRSRSEFIDRVSHTLKTPLTRMRLLAENITSGWVKDEGKRMDFLKTIISETEAMNETIHQMLSFSQIDSGKKHYRFSRISLIQILSEYLSGHPYREIIRIEQEDDLPLIDGDPEGIRLIISNLVQNGVKYSPGKKDILIRLKQKGDSIILEIRDHGIGIPEADRKRVFEKFFRSESPEVMAIEGNGLGLFLVQHAVTAHGGKISVESVPGKGTSFFITLPLRAAGSAT